MLQLCADREVDTLSIEVTDGVATCLIYDDLPDYLLNGLIDFIHRCYSPLAVIVNVADRDRQVYYIAQSGNGFDFDWATQNLNELEPKQWLRKSPNLIWGDTCLKIGGIVQTLQASRLPASEAKDTSPKERRSPLLKWFPLALISVVSFALGALI